MSDYLFLLESRLSHAQWQALAQVQKAAEALGVNLYLAGGTVRDLVGGFPIEDLDFVVEGNALKLARALAKEGAEIRWQSETLRTAELAFSSVVMASVTMARSEVYAKPGAAPAVAPAPIVAHLRRRDFSINAMGISLNPQSRGLLLDPTNAVADIERKAIRVLYNVSFFDDPSRLFRAVRFRTRLHYSLEAKTAAQFESAQSSDMAAKITNEALAVELRQIAREPNAVEVLKALDKEKLLTALSPRLRGPALNWQLLMKADKASQSLAEAGLQAPSFALFLHLLLRKLPLKEQAQLAKRISLDKKQWQAMQAFEAGAKRLDKEILSKEAARPAQLYPLFAAASPDLLLLLLIESSQKKVVSRIQTYLKIYLPLRAQLPEIELQEMGVAPGTDRYRKILDAFFFELLKGKVHTRTQQMKLLHALVQSTR
ncbi:MAG: hypothetical protein HY649_10510 [Acidobacteria bacterium]|nr:hypothetical protein [Acidobacteriota bacterium]